MIVSMNLRTSLQFSVRWLVHSAHSWQLIQRVYFSYHYVKFGVLSSVIRQLIMQLARDSCKLTVYFQMFFQSFTDTNNRYLGRRIHFKNQHRHHIFNLTPSKDNGQHNIKLTPSKDNGQHNRQHNSQHSR